ncbi:MAG: methyltransferase domain-containing protein [bacterium]|nr:methyltransferase domain-containing protein [bacterium]
MKLFKSIINAIGNGRAERKIGVFQDFVRKGEKVLDIGAGGGWIGGKLREMTGAQVTLLDVADFNRTDLPLVLYDGATIPFPDSSFDATLLLYVLHHCQDPLVVLKEAVRVSKGNIIILEDTFTSRFDRAFVCLHDFTGNLPGILFRGPEEQINMPLHFKSVKAWEEMFRKLGCKVIAVRQIQSFPIKQVLFVLEKC